MPKYVKLFTLAIVLAALCVFFMTGSVFADDEAPVEAPPVEKLIAEGETLIAPPVEEAPPAEELVAEEPLLAEKPLEEAPPAEELVVEEPPLEEQPLEEAHPAEELVAEEPPLAEQPLEEPLVEEAVVEPIGEVPAEETLVQPAPEEAVVLVDEAGEPLTLATEETAELLSSGDPYYKVGTKTYSFYAASGMCGVTPNCFDNQGPDVIQDALDHMSTSGLPSDRKLYVEGGTYGGFVINGFDNPLMALLNGVIGVDGSENTWIEGDIIVSDNTGGFTLQGFTVNSGGGVYFNSNSGTARIADVVVVDSNDNYGIEVSGHNGAIILDRVNSNSSDYGGAYLDNWPTTNPVTVTNSIFQHNGWHAVNEANSALVIMTNGTVTLDGVVADDNKGDAIRVYDYGTLKVSNTFIYNNHSITSDWGYALQAYTDGIGTAYLEDVYAYGNDYGIYVNGGNLRAKNIESNDSLEGYGLEFYSGSGSSSVEIGHFHNNQLDGLHIENKGSIYLSSIQASGNGGAGAYLDNAYFGLGGYVGVGPVTLTSPASGGSVMANNFSDNGDTGLSIQSRGAITISNADFYNNGSIGLFVDNTPGLGSVTVNVTLKNWYNGVGNNYNNGIFIQSRGTVLLSDTSADSNASDGIYVETLGNIELVNVHSTSNFGYGAFLDNDASTYPRTVKLTDSSFDHNQGNGVEVHSRGAISAYGLSASGNSLLNKDAGYYSNVITYNDLLGDDWVEDIYTFYGVSGQPVDLYLQSEDFDSYLVLIDPDGIGVSSDDDGWYDYNSHIGVNLAKSGTYTVVVKSRDNSGHGEYLFSLNDAGHTNVNEVGYLGALLQNDAGSAGVSIYKPKNIGSMWGNYFDGNTDHGIVVYSNGTITIDAVSASENLHTGLVLDNPSSRAAVTLQNTRTDGFYSGFIENGSIGVYINTQGNITVKNIGAWGNYATGAYLDNYTNGGFGSIMVLASSGITNDFGNNGDNGLTIYSNGSVQLVNVNASGNQYRGIYVLNNFPGKTGSVSVTNLGTYELNIDSNGSDGMVILSNGSITLNSVKANANGWRVGGHGVSLQNQSSLLSPAISITRAEFNENDGYGLFAISKGNITWFYGGASGNGEWGGYLENLAGLGYVLVSGSSRERMGFGGNGWHYDDFDGLEVNSNGRITLAYADAGNNSGDGFDLENDFSSTNQGVIVTEVEANGNQRRGLNVDTKGVITVNGINSSGNGLEGALLDNHDGIGGVTVSTTTGWTANHFNGNGWDAAGTSGLMVPTSGSVYLMNIGANGNSGDGITVDNNYGTAPVTYVTTGKIYWINENGGSGLYINSGGNVTLTNQYGLFANNNGGEGIDIHNGSALLPSYVRLTNVGASDNSNGKGINVEASGYIYASSLTTENNNYIGTQLISYSGPVTVTGSNTFRGNGWTGIFIESAGSVSLSNATAWGNVGNGVEVYSYSSAGTTSIYNVKSAHNMRSGVQLYAYGNSIVNRVVAFLNGQDDYGGLSDDGLSIFTNNPACKVSILNSTFMTNWWGSGIEIVHPNTAFWPYLYNTKYLANGETNLWVH